MTTKEILENLQHCYDSKIYRREVQKSYRQHSDECSDSCEELSILGIHKFPSRDAVDILSVKSSLQFVVDVWHENADPTCKCNGPLSIDEYLGAVPMKPEVTSSSVQQLLVSRNFVEAKQMKM
uniref:Uncharacterized protein n=1 Tax=Glossina austeni TaxID=7395 RepID=A0A1A9V717_GLOAU